MTAPARAPVPAPPAPVLAHAPEVEWSARALVPGILVGGLLCVANLYTGLQAGLWDSGQITASILAFGIGSALFRSRLSRLETNTAQTLAAAAGAMPAAAGLLGAIPALSLVGTPVAAWAVVPWGIALGALGVLAALALRPRLIEAERLPFPTGVATAEVIGALHADREGARESTRTLLLFALCAGVVTWLRQGKPALVPADLVLPLAVAGIPLSALSFGLSTSPLLWGIGIVAGLRVGLSMLAGSAIGWLVLGPWLVEGPLHVPLEYGQLSEWLTWPGVALLTGASVVALAQQAGAFAGAVRDLRTFASGKGEAARNRTLVLSVAIALAAAAVVVVLGTAAFGLRPAHTVLALLLSFLFATVCARSAGQTDISPAGPVGQLTQAVFGAIVPGRPALNIAAGSVVAGTASHTGVALWSMRAGHALGASPRRMGAAALVGVAVGGVLCVPAYELLVRANGIGSARLPIPAAAQFKAMGELVSHGLSALPTGALPAVAVAAALGLVLALLEKTRLGRFLPTPFAMGIGLLVPLHLSAGVAAGGVVLALTSRMRPGFAQRSAPVVGAGLIAGESLVGLLVALLVAFGVL